MLNKSNGTHIKMKCDYLSQRVQDTKSSRSPYAFYGSKNSGGLYAIIDMNLPTPSTLAGNSKIKISDICKFSQRYCIH